VTEITRAPLVLPPVKSGRPSKYRNRTVGGYASLKEGRRAAELKLLEKAGQIRQLKEQVSFLLIPAQMDKQGKWVERACSYVADFVYDELVNDGKLRDGSWRTVPHWETVVEDVKSPPSRTPEYVIKRKLMLKVHGIRIRET
jgi:hypothetical protein